MAGATDILSTLEECSMKMHSMIDFYDHKHETYFAELAEFVPRVKAELDLIDLTRNSRAKVPSVSRKKSAVHKKRGTSSTATGETRSTQGRKSGIETASNYEIVITIESTEKVEHQESNCVPEESCDLAVKSSSHSEISSQTLEAVKLPVVTKASKHRQSTCPSQTSLPDSSTEKSKNGSKSKEVPQVQKAATKGKTAKTKKNVEIKAVKQAPPAKAENKVDQQKQMNSQKDKIEPSSAIKKTQQTLDVPSVPPKGTLDSTFTVEDEYVDYPISDFRDSDDDDDDCSPTKPVPKWAGGLHLKQAVLNQFRDLPDVKAIFGRMNVSPTETFGVKLKKKVNRNSSAIWASPDQSFLLF